MSPDLQVLRAVLESLQCGRFKAVQSYRLLRWKRALRTARDVEQAVPVNCWSRRVGTRLRFHADSPCRAITNLRMVWQRRSGTHNRLHRMLISYPKWSCSTWEGTWNWPFDGCRCRPALHYVLSTKSRACNAADWEPSITNARSSRYITTPMACWRRYLTRARMCLVKTRGLAQSPKLRA